MATMKNFPMLPMRDIVVFPHMTTPFFIGRKQSMEALENALAADRQVFVIAQRDPMVEKPTREDLFDIGTIGNILQIMPRAAGGWTRPTWGAAPTQHGSSPETKTIHPTRR